MVLTFMVNLLCAYVSCVKLRELPSDPISAQASSLIYTAVQYNNNNRIFEPPPDLTVFVKSGGLEGYQMRTIKNRSIFAFEGIPFGESTGGEARFKPPVAKEPWVGVREAKKPGDFCVQFHMIRYFIFGSEDCLFLNVYTPELPSDGGLQNPSLPVIVFIHGGAYFFGSGAEYGPSYLLEEDVILVTINYRLGVLGFLSSGDRVLPGNNGLKDQALAIKWVHENIEAFGGDPTRVTVMGQSSGGASTHMHMISSKSREYFSGAISLSGTAFTSWSIMNRAYANDSFQKVAKFTNCYSRKGNSTTIVECLRKANPYFLAGKIGQLFAVPGIPSAPVAPVIEPEGPDAFLTKHPHQVYAEGGVAKIPWISSSTGDEGSFPIMVMTSFQLEWLVKRLWDIGAPTVLDYKFVAKNPNEVTKQINQFYFGANSVTKVKNASAFGDLFTDRWFAYALHKSLQAHSTVAPTYSHVFGYKGSHGLPEYLGQNKDDFGVGHIDDLPFIFNMSGFFPGYKTSDEEYAIIKLMTNLIANFAKKREPLYTSPDGQDFQIWDSIKDPKNISVLQIQDEVKMIKEPNEKRLRFWENVPLNDIKPWIRFED